MNPDSVSGWLYLHQSLELLADSIDQYKKGKTGYYRVAAAQLRLLFCDTTRRHDRIVDISLVRQILPDLRLTSPDTPDQAQDPSLLLNLEDWLEYEVEFLSGEKMTIRSLIREICDRDGGVHVDLGWKRNQAHREAMREKIMLIAKIVVSILRLTHHRT